MTTEVETALRDTLADAAGVIAVPEDPWPRFARVEGAHRRTRRIRVAAASGLLAAAVAIQTNMLPLPGWAPGIATASHASPLADAPTRGALAADTAWLDELRREIKDIQDPDGLWRVADRDAIRFVYADEVPGHRVALALVPLRLGIFTAWELIWYEGPTGATAQQMRQSGNESADQPISSLMLGSDQATGFAAVVGPVGSTVSISTSFRYSPAGVVERPSVQPSPAGSGIGVVAVPAGGYQPGVSAKVVEGDRVLFEGSIGGGWSSGGAAADAQEPTDAMVAEALANVRGPAVDPAVLRRYLQAALVDARLPAEGTTARVLWSGTVNTMPAVLFTVQPTGGGVIAYAMRGRGDTSWQDMRLLLPAKGAATRPLAWRMRVDVEETRTGRVIVVAPPAAARVSISVAGGSQTPVALDADGMGTATAPPDQPAVVTAYAADGGTIASTPVPDFENSSGGIPGDTPKTRIVP